MNCSKLKSSFVLWAINYELNDFINQDNFLNISFLSGQNIRNETQCGRAAHLILDVRSKSFKSPIITLTLFENCPVFSTSDLAPPS